MTLITLRFWSVLMLRRLHDVVVFGAVVMVAAVFVVAADIVVMIVVVVDVADAAQRPR